MIRLNRTTNRTNCQLSLKNKEERKRKKKCLKEEEEQKRSLQMKKYKKTFRT